MTLVEAQDAGNTFYVYCMEDAREQAVRHDESIARIFRGWLVMDDGMRHVCENLEIANLALLSALPRLLPVYALVNEQDRGNPWEILTIAGFAAAAYRHRHSLAGGTR